MPFDPHEKRDWRGRWTDESTGTVLPLASLSGAPVMRIPGYTRVDGTEVPTREHAFTDAKLPEEDGVNDSAIGKLDGGLVHVKVVDEHARNAARDAAASIAFDRLHQRMLQNGATLHFSVPHSAHAELEGRPVVLTEHVRGFHSEDREDADPKSAHQMLMFDHFLGNEDRHTGNFLLTGGQGEARVHAIDNDQAFGLWGGQGGREADTGEYGGSGASDLTPLERLERHVGEGDPEPLGPDDVETARSLATALEQMHAAGELAGVYAQPGEALTAAARARRFADALAEALRG